jgi:hypothetical protein
MKSSSITVRHALFSATVILAFLFLPTLADCATRTYFGADNGFWTNLSNWSPSGVPIAGNDVFLGSHSAGATDLHVTYDSTSQAQLNSVTLNSSALAGYMIVNQTSASSLLLTNTLNIGTTSIDNTWNQSAGFMDADAINIGVNASSSANNSYNLSGTGELNGLINVGVSGTGVFNMSGGKSGVNDGSIVVGVNSGSNGTVNLSGGQMIETTVTVGNNGTGVFNQTGGASYIQFLNIAGPTGNGTFNITGGTLTSYNPGGIVVGGGTGTGVFNLSNATVTSDVGVVASSGGTFNLKAGGNLTADITLKQGGLFNQTGGALTGNVSASSGGSFNLQGGTITGNVNLNSGGLFTLQGGTFTSAPGVDTTGGILRLNGKNLTVASLTGTGGTVQNFAAANDTLTLNLTTFNGSYAGVIQNGGSGKLSLTKTGGFTQTLSGTNTYSGATIIGGGALAAGSNGGFSSASDFLVNVGTLDAGGFDVTVGSLGGLGGTVAVGSGSFTSGVNGFSTSYDGVLTGGGTFNKVGAGQLTLTGGGSFTGNIDVKGGSLLNTAVNSIPAGASLTLSGTGTALNLGANQTFAALSGASLGTVNFLNNSILTVGGNNANTTYAGAFTGGGVLTKLGTGTFTLGTGIGDTASGNTDASLTFNVLGGTLALNKADGTNAIAGPLNLFNNAIVQLNNSNQIADTSVVTMNGGTFNVAGQAETIGGLIGATGTVNASGNLTVAQSVNATFGGSLVGNGGFFKAGAADLTLNGAGSYDGKFTVNGGRLILGGAVNTLGGTANSGGTLRFESADVNLNNTFLRANSGGAVEYLNTSVNNGFLRGSGIQTILAGGTTSFNGVTTFNSTVIAQNGTTFFNNFSNGGTLNNNVPAQFDGAVNESSGVVNVNSTLTTADFSSSGVINIPAGGKINNVGGNLVLGGGSRTYVGTAAAPGGTLAMSAGANIQLNGGLLVNNGTITGTTNINFGSLAKGAGSFGIVNIMDGGKFSPGNSPGTATMSALSLGSGGHYDFELNSATATSGVGSDLIMVSGILDVAGGLTANSRFTVALITLDGSNNPASLADFNPSLSYTFVLATAAGGIIGFNAAEFTVDTSGFQNSLLGGSFSIGQSGNDLIAQFQPGAVVPEPATWTMMLAGCALLGCAQQFRRRKKA